MNYDAITAAMEHREAIATSPPVCPLGDRCDEDGCPTHDGRDDAEIAADRAREDGEHDRFGEGQRRAKWMDDVDDNSIREG